MNSIETINLWARLSRKDSVTGWGMELPRHFKARRVIAGREWYGTYSPKHGQNVWFCENELLLPAQN